MPSPAHPSRYITISDAAQTLGLKPWDVVRLIESEQISSVQFVDVESLRRFQQEAS